MSADLYTPPSLSKAHDKNSGVMAELRETTSSDHGSDKHPSTKLDAIRDAEQGPFGTHHNRLVASSGQGPHDAPPTPEQQAADLAARFPDIDERKLYRKIDFALVPWLSFLYLLSFLDRTAIGNAKLFHMLDKDQLNLSSTQFNIATSVFFFTYAIFEVPSNVLLKRLRPSVWFPIITCLVGVCMLSQGVVKNYGGLIAARLMLGVTEAGLFPGVNYLLSGWYTRKQFGTRAAIFFSAATVSGAFGGLLSVALSKMDGVGGYAGWRWIFIIIGLVTFLSGVVSIWLVQDFPETAKFLTEREREYVIAKLQGAQQYSAAGQQFEWKFLWKGVLDPKTWVAALAYSGADGPLYSFSIFTPTIVQALGYTSVRANLISVPIYAVACLFTLLVGFVADRRGNRALINVVMLSVAVAGYIILIASRLPGLSYFAIYLAAIGIYPCIPNTIALTTTGVEGTYKRSVVSAFVIGYGNINGAATTNVYTAKGTGIGKYARGHGLILLWLGLGILSNVAYALLLRRDNVAKRQGKWSERILEDEAEFVGDATVTATGVATDSTPSEEKLRRRAEQIRSDEASSARFFLARWRKAVHEGPGGTYATAREAKELKGDAYSGFVYSY